MTLDYVSDGTIANARSNRLLFFSFKSSLVIFSPCEINTISRQGSPATAERLYKYKNKHDRPSIVSPQSNH